LILRGDETAEVERVFRSHRRSLPVPAVGHSVRVTHVCGVHHDAHVPFEVVVPVLG
jgi:hypothetical protein